MTREDRLAESLYEIAKSLGLARRSLLHFDELPAVDQKRWRMFARRLPDKRVCRSQHLHFLCGLPSGHDGKHRDGPHHEWSEREAEEDAVGDYGDELGEWT